MPQFLNIDGRVLHVAYRPGDRGPVVFSNSLGTDLRIWDGVVDRLPDDIAVLRIDKRGHGLSALGPVTISALAEDMAAAMDHFGFADAVACGVSVGGLIVQRLALDRPDLVRAAVLSNTGLKVGNDAMWNERIATARSKGLEVMAEGILTRWFGPSFHEGRPDELAGYREMLVRTPAEGYARVSEAIRDTDHTAEAHLLTQPTICIAGEGDQATPVALVTALADALPNAQLTTLPVVGHLPCIEAPGAVVRALEELGLLA